MASAASLADCAHARPQRIQIGARGLDHIRAGGFQRHQRFVEPFGIAPDFGLGAGTFDGALLGPFKPEGARRETGGGTLQDALTHLMNLGEFLLGPIHRIVADCDRLVLEGIEGEDTAHVLTRQGTIMGLYGYNQHQAPNDGVMMLICERGTFRVEANRMRWQVVTEPETPWTVHQLDPIERDDTFVIQAHRFLDYVANQEAEPLCRFEEGLQTLRGNLAIMQAADTQTWVDV